MKNIVGISVALLLVVLVLLPTAAMAGLQLDTGMAYQKLNKKIGPCVGPSDGSDNDPGNDPVEDPTDTFGYTIEDDSLPPGVNIWLVNPAEPEDDDDLPTGGGWKSSFLLIRGLYNLDFDLRFHLYKAKVIEWTWFNGFRHESFTDGYVEVWLDDDEQTYGSAQFSFHNVWSGFSPFFLTGNGIEIQCENALWVHVYAERTVDNYPTELHDVWIYKHLVYP